MPTRVDVSEGEAATILEGARYVLGPNNCVDAELEIVSGRIASIRKAGEQRDAGPRAETKIDLRGFVIMPGLINAHDHLQFALFPRLGNPPYPDYIEWGNNIHATQAATIMEHKSVPRNVRLWWGGIRNLLCGVTTVCHHDPLWPELLNENFPVRALRRYGWAHSVALGGDLREAHRETPNGGPFLIHACEGVNDLARAEVFALHQAGVLDRETVLIHGLALDKAGVDLVNESGASLILCPSSNEFLFERIPEMGLSGAIKRVALGNDSPLTARGDLLDEIRFTIESCGVAPERVYNMVTIEAAAILQIEDAAILRLTAPADLVAVRDNGANAAERMHTLSFRDIELVMLDGKVQLASGTIWRQLPASLRKSMEPLWIDGVPRWLRAPIASLLQEAEARLGRGCVKLGGRSVRQPDPSEIESAITETFQAWPGVRI